MGKEPAMLAPLQARVSTVACHPKQDILAAGYSDGTILMVRLTDGAEILVRRSGADAGRGAGMECQGHAIGVRRRGWRCGIAGAVASRACVLGSRGEQCVAMAVDPAENSRADKMALNDKTRAFRQDMLIASAMVAVGFGISVFSVAELRPVRRKWRRRRNRCRPLRPRRRITHPPKQNPAARGRPRRRPSPPSPTRRRRRKAPSPRCRPRRPKKWRRRFSRSRLRYSLSMNLLFVMAGPVPTIHAFLAATFARRGCPGQARA